jgi:hypothetical protein
MEHFSNLENALTKVVKTALRKKKDYLAKTYYSYLRILEIEKNPDNYIRALSRRLIPNEDAFKERMAKYRQKYYNDDIYTSLENLYKIYYEIAKEENQERSEEEVELMFRELTIKNVQF